MSDKKILRRICPAVSDRNGRDSDAAPCSPCFRGSHWLLSKYIRGCSRSTDLNSEMENSTNHLARNIGLVCAAAFLRSMSTGTLGVVLAVYLFRNGLSATWIWAVIASGLAGSAVATALISYRADV